MHIVQKWLRAAEAKRQAEKEQGLGFEAGLTLIEVAAAIGISIILAFVIVVAVTGLFSSAKHSSTIQALTNVSTAANAYYGVSGGTFSGLSGATLSSQATGVTFTTSVPINTQIGYDVNSGATTDPNSVAVFEMIDPGSSTGSGCVAVADVGVGGSVVASGNTGIGSAPGIFWSTGTCEAPSSLLTGALASGWGTQVPNVT